MFKRIWAIFLSRNKEFYRDKSAFGWNILFPLLIIVGFSFLFSGDKQTLYKAVILNENINKINNNILSRIKSIRYVEFINFESRKIALNKLKRHRVDLVFDNSTNEYWISNSSPKSYIVEKILFSNEDIIKNNIKKSYIVGKEIPYIEWLFPGILGMNIMFSALFGIGYVVVRYRKNNVLKRLSITPIHAYEFLFAQILSRLFVLFVTTAFVFIVCKILYKFNNYGSYFSLIFVFLLGSMSMISLGLLIAARSSSEEFAGGILNLISWPMMFLSEVWFSLEGSHPIIIKISKIFPLTQMVDALRKIMNEGASLVDVKFQILSLLIMTIVFLLIGSYFFKWQSDV